MDTKVTIYFDGLCHLCSREVEHYARVDREQEIAYVDISATDFDARSHGLDARLVQRTMHVRDASGRVVTGVDAFITVWQALPDYRRLARVARLPGVHAALRGGYALFALIRPYLPKRARGACSIRSARDGTPRSSPAS